VDENIHRNVSISEDLYGIIHKIGEDVKETNTMAIGLSGKLGYYHKMTVKICDAYYQYIMGNMTRDNVKTRLSKEG